MSEWVQSGSERARMGVGGQWSRSRTGPRGSAGTLTKHADAELLVGTLALAGSDLTTKDVDPELLVRRVGAALLGLDDVDVVAPE